ncbi:MAG: hypothetical protein E7342_01305 [Clostridiales bacterium]|nr:hypothetical protein [Clostridiales bacterium]
MKKRFFKILIAVCLALATALTVVGCKDTGSTNLSLTKPGKVLSNAGFVVETENYVYFINGVEQSSKDNDYGTPVKGALMVADKKDLSTAEIAVPKLMVASDYEAGIYVYGDSVYYATPTTQKNASGDVAYEYVDFCKSTLDGKETKTYFSVIGSVLEYRILEVEGTVYIVYYNGNSQELISFNTKTETSQVIKSAVESFNFLPNDMTNDFVVTYTVSVEKSWTSGEETPTTYKYNKVYGYNVKEGEKLLLDGEVDGNGNEDWKSISYAIVMAENGYVYYTATEGYEVDADLQIKYYAITASDLYKGNKTATLLNAKAKDYLVETNLVVSPSEIYFADGEFVAKDSLVGTALLNKEIVAKATFAEIDGIYENYVYGKTVDSEIIRVEKDKETTEVVAENVYGEWYDYKIVNGKVFYIDAEYGINNVSFVEIANADVQEEKDDKGEVIKTYLAGKKSIGKLTAEDNLTLANAFLEELKEDSEIILEEGKETSKKIEKAEKAYNALTDDQKKEFGDANYEVIENYKKALEVSNLLIKLEKFEYANTDAERDVFKADYEVARKAVGQLLENGESGVLTLLVENGRWYLQQAGKYFA